MKYEKMTKPQLIESSNSLQEKVNELEEKLYWERQRGVSKKSNDELLALQNEKSELGSQITNLLNTIQSLEKVIKEQGDMIKGVEEYINLVESYLTQNRVSLELFENLKNKTLKEIIGGK